jgi:hypothetical protein
LKIKDGAEIPGNSMVDSDIDAGENSVIEEKFRV